MDFSIKQAGKVIWDYLSLYDTPEKAEAIFLCGGSTLSPPDKAAELYRRGFAKDIFFLTKGGTFSLPQWKGQESLVYYKRLKLLGIPKELIHWKMSCINTLEEAQQSVPFIKSFGINPKTVILISRPVHQRRAYATFKKQHPTVTFISVPGDEVFHLDHDLVIRLDGELERLQTYAQKGDLEPQHLDKKVLEAWKILQTEVKHGSLNYG